MATRKFLEKGNSIVLRTDPAAPVEGAPDDGRPHTDAFSPLPRAPRSPRTAIGGMAAFMREESVVIGELEALKAQHAPYVGADPVRQLDPRSIRRSRWANRHSSSFTTKDFAGLRDEIRSAGGNNQPIKVRPVPVDALTDDERGATPAVAYEIVYGHRRHAACLELRIPVTAVIQARNDRELFEDMERENRERADLSPYEQGAMYVHALEEGLYPSMRQLAEAVGADISSVSKACALAGLPKPVLDAFPTPVEIQVRWAKPLNDAQQRDPDLLLNRARSLRSKGAGLTAAQVFKALIAAENEAAADDRAEVIAGPAGKARITQDRKGRLTLRFDRALTPQARSELKAFLQKVLER